MRSRICLVLIIIFLLNGCKKKEEPNPCTGKQRVSAAFNMYEFSPIEHTPSGPIPPALPLIDTDTLLRYEMMFEAKQEGLSYEWTLGTETITEKSFVREGFPYNTPITVTLKVRGIPDEKCFPGDDAIDVQTRTFVRIRGTCENIKITGAYKGTYSDAPKDTVTLDINACGPKACISCDSTFIIMNLFSKGCKAEANPSYYVGFKQFSAQFATPNGIDGRNECVPKFTPITGLLDGNKITLTLPDKKFTGIKIQK